MSQLPENMTLNDFWLLSERKVDIKGISFPKEPLFVVILSPKENGRMGRELGEPSTRVQEPQTEYRVFLSEPRHSILPVPCPPSLSTLTLCGLSLCSFLAFSFVSVSLEIISHTVHESYFGRSHCGRNVPSWSQLGALTRCEGPAGSRILGTCPPTACGKQSCGSGEYQGRFLHRLSVLLV